MTRSVVGGSKVLRWIARGGLIAGLMSWIALCGHSSAEAQMTVERLIGSAVAEIGDQYQDVEAAITRFGNNDVDGARQLLERAKQTNVELAPAEVMLAQLHFAANQMPAGRNELEKAVIDSPSDPEAYLFFGELAYRERRFTDAAELFVKADSLCQKFTQNKRRGNKLLIRGYAGLTSVAESRQQWTRAEKYLSAWLQTEPESTVAHTRLGRALFQLAEQEKDEKAQKKHRRAAYAEFRKNVEIDPRATRAEVNMALLYEQAGKRPNAKKLMELAVRRTPDNLKTRLTVAQWAVEAGLVSMAKANAEAALKLDGSSLQAKLLVGLVARYSADYAAAAAVFQLAHVQAPSDFGAMNNLALSLIELPDEDQRQRALEYANLNTRAYADTKLPRGREAAVTYAWILFRLGHEAEANRAMQAALRGGSVSGEAFYHAAQLFHDLGRPEIARRILQSSLNNKGAFPSRGKADQLRQRLIRNQPAGDKKDKE